MLNYKRPVLVFGHGVRLAGAIEEASKLATLTGWPIVTTWGASDAFGAHPQWVGSFGTHGNKFVNLTVQNADFVLCVGTRLDTKATGHPASSFAPRAKIEMVDIDQSEIDKFKTLGRDMTGHREDAKEFLRKQVRYWSALEWPKYAVWWKEINEWRRQYPVIRDEWFKEESVNPYVFVYKLSEYIEPDDIIVSDTGCVLGWMMQAFQWKGQRFVHAFNNTPMGYGLPAAIGAAFATSRRVALITGDGGLAVNITELATVAKHRLPIKIILFNNKGHAMCRQTQRQWLRGEYPATSEEGGLACPDYAAVAEGYGIASDRAFKSNRIDKHLEWLIHDSEPAMLDVQISPDHGIVGQIKFGEPLAEAA